MSLFLSGFLPKGLQRLASRLLDCLFAADTKGINYLAHKNIAFAFLHCAGLKINHVTLAPNVGPSLKTKSEDRTFERGRLIQGLSLYFTNC